MNLIGKTTINLGKSTRLVLPSENTVFKTNGVYKISCNADVPRH